MSYLHKLKWESYNFCYETLSRVMYDTNLWSFICVRTPHLHRLQPPKNIMHRPCAQCRCNAASLTSTRLQKNRIVFNGLFLRWPTQWSPQIFITGVYIVVCVRCAVVVHIACGFRACHVFIFIFLVRQRRRNVFFCATCVVSGATQLRVLQKVHN